MVESVILLTSTTFYATVAVCFVLGFGAALLLRYPTLVLKKWMMSLSGGRPKPLVMIYKDGSMSMHIVPTADGKYNPERTIEGNLRQGQALNIAGLGSGYVYYEGCIAPLDLSSQSLDKAAMEAAEQLQAQTEHETRIINPGMGFRALSPMVVSQHFTYHRLLAKKLAEETINKRLGLLVGIILVVVVINLIAAVYQLSIINEISKGFNVALAQLQQANFGIKP